eukprot:COSAG02_NODE_55871_length_288_cov_0.814815_1_plen_60_part_01
MVIPISPVHKAAVAAVSKFAGGDHATTYSILFVITDLLVFGVADTGHPWRGGRCWLPMGT